jgi:hypothetical protein
MVKYTKCRAKARAGRTGFLGRKILSLRRRRGGKVAIKVAAGRVNHEGGFGERRFIIGLGDEVMNDSPV